MEDLIPLGLLASYAVLLLLDLIAPARAYTQVRLWRLKGLGAFVISMALFVTLPFVWDEYLGTHRVIDLTDLGIVSGALVGLLVQQFVSYWWHRTMHRTPLLWRWFHQMHHSPERVDAFGAFYFHPLDVVGFAFVGSLSLVFLVGLNPGAVLVANATSTFAAYFQHANLRTPRWLGYIIHRPENHAAHHERGVHAYNYGDIALWDMVFGTFKNPATFDAEAGFYDGASARIGEMLIGRDVSKAPSPQAATRAPSVESAHVGATP